MNIKKWAASGILGLAAAFSFAAFYRPEKIEVSGTLAEVGSISNELKEIGLRKSDGKIVKFDVSSLGLVAEGNIELSKTRIYRAVSEESLLQKAVRAVFHGSGDFNDWNYKANSFGLCPMTMNCSPGK